MEVTVSAGRVIGFRFYSQCEGRVYEASAEVRACVERSVAAWRYRLPYALCDGTINRTEQTEQLYLEPIKPNDPGEVRSGCA